MQNHWIVLFPPILVILCASITRRIQLSFVCGIISAALIVSDFKPFEAAMIIKTRFLEKSELMNLLSFERFWKSSNLFLILFLLILGMIIILMHRSGGAYAFGNFAAKRIKKASGAECFSLVMSLFFFIDDYFSSLTVGSVMQAITDRFRVPRIKLALLVNSVAAPLAVLIPLSSWLAQITGQFKNSGIGLSASNIIGDPFFVYVHVIPYFFYLIVTLVSIWFFVIRRISYGILYQHEQIAQQTGDLFAGKQHFAKRDLEIPRERKEDSSLIDFTLPLLLLLGSVVFRLLCRGEYWLFGGKNSLLVALLQSGDIAEALFLGSLFTLGISFIFLLIRGKILIGEVSVVIQEGFGLMGSTMFTLFLIWTLSHIIVSDLGTGQYLANLVVGHVGLAYFPVMFFCISACVAVMMGTAWGTIGMMIPLGVPMLLSYTQVQLPVAAAHVAMLYPVIGAIISGAVVGNHLSPLADVLLMSATSAGANQMDFYRAQVGFALPCVVSTVIAYIFFGVFQTFFSQSVSVLLALGYGVGINVIILTILNYVFRSSEKLFKK